MRVRLIYLFKIGGDRHEYLRNTILNDNVWNAHCDHYHGGKNEIILRRA